MRPPLEVAALDGSAAGERRDGDIGPDGPTGTFTDRHAVVPW